jgi:hypothetical protein
MPLRDWKSFFGVSEEIFHEKKRWTAWSWQIAVQTWYCFWDLQLVSGCPRFFEISCRPVWMSCRSRIQPREHSTKTMDEEIRVQKKSGETKPAIIAILRYSWHNVWRRFSLILFILLLSRVSSMIKISSSTQTNKLAFLAYLQLIRSSQRFMECCLQSLTKSSDTTDYDRSKSAIWSMDISYLLTRLRNSTIVPSNKLLLSTLQLYRLHRSHIQSTPSTLTNSELSSRIERPEPQTSIVSQNISRTISVENYKGKMSPHTKHRSLNP